MNTIIQQVKQAIRKPYAWPGVSWSSEQIEIENEYYPQLTQENWKETFEAVEEYLKNI